MTKGKWAIWSRGTNPDPWTRWVEVTGDVGNTSFDAVLAMFLLWRSQGQHVRLEWMPEGSYGPQALKANRYQRNKVEGKTKSTKEKDD